MGTATKPDMKTPPMETGPAQWQGAGLLQQASAYWIDSWQRSILFLDLLRQRGNDHFEQAARVGPNVLSFDFEVVLDGRTFERPVNYCLVRIVDPDAGKVDPRRRPFIVFDPRAGHGPGIGGMKRDSEIGVALRDGHPCYFVGFLPEPVVGQTIEDVCRAEARFVEEVAKRHPDAEGKPCLIGNCQAGWQIAMMSAVNPDLAGPILLVGAPLSYWAGVHGKNPLRYLGGLLGGTWLTSLAGDLGDGIFDGANLVANFESMNPANTLWKKNYQVYANIDTEAGRFLAFEKWWGSPVLMNAEEMQFIADELFIGNKLSSGEIFLSDDTRVDLRNIKSPIVVFCSWGDDITPPQQALGWILDLYDDDEALIAGGQTIVYALHHSVGHLGIFVSAKVATKEHDEFTRTMDLIDVLPPGLYEAVLTEKSPDTAHAELVSGDYLVRFEERKLDDIRALGTNDAEDERRFAAVARLSDVNQGLYRKYASPSVRATANRASAEWMRRLHPHRVRFEIFSDKNPWMRAVRDMAEAVRASRVPAAADNPFRAYEGLLSERIAEALDLYRDVRDQATERFFLDFYGAPLVQALAGLQSDLSRARLRVGRDVAREAAEEKGLASLERLIGQGGLIDAGLRALLYVTHDSATRIADERVFATVRHIRQSQPQSRQVSLAQFKEMVRKQHLLLRHDEERAVEAIPQMLPDDASERDAMIEAVRQAVVSTGDLSKEGRRRLSRVEALFGAVAPAKARLR